MLRVPPSAQTTPGLRSRAVRGEPRASLRERLDWHARLIRTLQRASERLNSFPALRPCSRRSNWCFRPSNSIACMDLLPTVRSQFLLGAPFTYISSLWSLTSKLSLIPMTCDHPTETYYTRSEAFFVDFATCEFSYFHLAADIFFRGVFSMFRTAQGFPPCTT